MLVLLLLLLFLYVNLSRLTLLTLLTATLGLDQLLQKLQSMWLQTLPTRLLLSCLLESDRIEVVVYLQRLSLCRVKAVLKAGVEWGFFAKPTGFMLCGQAVVSLRCVYHQYLSCLSTHREAAFLPDSTRAEKRT